MWYLRECSPPLRYEWHLWSFGILRCIKAQKSADLIVEPDSLRSGTCAHVGRLSDQNVRELL